MYTENAGFTKKVSYVGSLICGEGDSKSQELAGFIEDGKLSKAQFDEKFIQTIR